ncbi:hypothetical protein [Marinilactibacillus psychrotolerans]|uniref:Antigen I/II N-terminal domain-containing protein n=1 Tax=Marinilactibacillus psychrotolerans TaxID=191770 RepID=A0AAV3X0Z4_9LACT|nr:hypothetical protein [Marinilactibacillus psychrotolerans]GEL68209.1 hypothetical protein MPS01_23640 [Marinilactibacillus psychrotolerans]GEQ36869.1 hypothetical protein M132T_23770 [Marinilactibacillus psychrotolerans]SDD47236.1 hypothetical protein SAMN04488013_1373 [Marinilactibacillus psychrotolerans]
MKLFKSLFLLSSSTLILAACGNDSDEQITPTEESAKEVDQDTSESSKSKEESGNIEVDKGIFSTEVTLPAEFAESFDPSEMDLESSNYTENEDGSVTLKLSKAQHKELLNSMKESVDASIEQLKTDDTYTSFEDIQYNDDFSEMSIIVDREAYESGMDGFGIFALALPTMFYQLFEGTPSEDLEVIFELEDAADGEVFDTIVYPDDLEEAEE